MNDVEVIYEGAERSAVSGVSIEAERGELIGLVGANGAGKTTTVNALVGLLTVASGRVEIDGVNAETMSLGRRLEHFGLLTQEFGRYEFSVRDVVRIGRPKGNASDAEIWRALSLAHAETLVRNMPDGLDTQLGSQFGGVGISGGEWQRIALARIYLRAAPIWVLDEPTSAIDAEAEQEIFAELRRTGSKRITIVVSHRAWTLKDMDRIYVFDAGRVVETGTYEDLMKKRGRFYEMFDSQLA